MDHLAQLTSRYLSSAFSGITNPWQSNFPNSIEEIIRRSIEITSIHGNGNEQKKTASSKGGGASKEIEKERDAAAEDYWATRLSRIP